MFDVVCSGHIGGWAGVGGVLDIMHDRRRMTILGVGGGVYSMSYMVVVG